jgi:hypothetical protein
MAEPTPEEMAAAQWLQSWAWLPDVNDDDLMALLAKTYNEFERREMTLQFDCAECGERVG